MSLLRIRPRYETSFEDPKRRTISMQLLSIRPQYAQAILDGAKRWEFRRRRLPEAGWYLLYASKPVGLIVGAITVPTWITSDVERLWRFCRLPGVSVEALRKYAGKRGRLTGHLIRQVLRFREPLDPRRLDPKFRPPQSCGNIYDCDLWHACRLTINEQLVEDGLL